MSIIKVKDWVKNGKTQFEFGFPYTNLAIRLSDKTRFKEGDLVLVKEMFGTISFFYSDLIHVHISFVVTFSTFKINDIEHISSGRR